MTTSGIHLKTLLLPGHSSVGGKKDPLTSDHKMASPGTFCVPGKMQNSVQEGQWHQNIGTVDQNIDVVCDHGNKNPRWT